MKNDFFCKLLMIFLCRQICVSTATPSKKDSHVFVIKTINVAVLPGDRTIRAIYEITMSDEFIALVTSYILT